MNRVVKWIVLGTGGLAASIILAVYGKAAIQTIAGLAVAQTSTQWNSVKDLAFGDNMTSGVLAAGCVFFDGTNFDRCRGDITNGLDVDVTRTPDSAGSTQSTTGVNANGAGTTVTMTTVPLSNFTMIIDRTAGTTNPVEIDLQCSINNVAFVQIATITDLTNEPVLTSVSGVPCAYMRYNVVTVGAGNTLAIDLLATR